MIKIYGDSLLFEKIELQNYIDYTLPYASNMYVYREVTELLTENINLNDFLILGWTDAYKDEMCNESLGLLTCRFNESLIVYDKQYKQTKKYYSEENKKDIELNFIQKQLYDELNVMVYEYMTNYKSDILYNMIIKIMYMISIDIVLTDKNVPHLFVDIPISKTNPSYKPLLLLTYMKKEKDEFLGILKQFKNMITTKQNYIVYSKLNDWLKQNHNILGEFI